MLPLYLQMSHPSPEEAREVLDFAIRVEGGLLEEGDLVLDDVDVGPVRGVAGGRGVGEAPAGAEDAVVEDRVLARGDAAAGGDGDAVEEGAAGSGVAGDEGAAGLGAVLDGDAPQSPDADGSPMPPCRREPVKASASAHAATICEARSSAAKPVTAHTYSAYSGTGGTGQVAVAGGLPAATACGSAVP